ncbi:MAG: DUF6516 family protein [candidate division KSB1 bacterium]|nr:DUF6516 family protein [candidate division KSB1 bacterium]MDZ7366421.1 DUF6516 family protein [candidate division KSB1 bacterium]MDZ7404617.1 DUF6516 family protein [candidate division KSB1 bacterium]
MWNISQYESLVYNIQANSQYIEPSNLVLQRRGKFNCWLIGSIRFAKSFRLEIAEALDFTSESFIRHYSYAVLRGDERLYWYDSQAHPNDPTLQSTHPHHKHIPPDIKHHRIPAPYLSFDKPNLPFPIREIEEQFLKSTTS